MQERNIWTRRLVIEMRTEQKFIDEDFLYEMSNLSRRKFKKLPTNIFMSAVNYPTPKGVWLSLNNSLPD